MGEKGGCFRGVSRQGEHVRMLAPLAGAQDGQVHGNSTVIAIASVTTLRSVLAMTIEPVAAESSL